MHGSAQQSDSTPVRSAMSSQRIREICDYLHRLIGMRADAEQQLDIALSTQTQQLTTTRDREAARIQAEADTEYQRVDSEYRQVREAAADLHSGELRRLQTEYDGIVSVANDGYSSVSKEADKQFSESQWMVTSVFDDDAGDNPGRRYEVFRGRVGREKDSLADQQVALQAVYDQTCELLQKRRQPTDFELPPPKDDTQSLDELHDRIGASAEGVHTARKLLERQWLPKQFEGFWPVLYAFVAFLVLVPIAVAFRQNPILLATMDDIDRDWLVLSSAVSAGIVVILFVTFYLAARSQTLNVFHQLQQHLSNARGSHDNWTGLSKKELKRMKSAAAKWEANTKARREAALHRAEKTRSDLLAEAGSSRDSTIGAAEQTYPAQIAQTESKRDTDFIAIDSRFKHQLDEIRSGCEDELQRLNSSFEAELADVTNMAKREFELRADEWRNGYDAAITELTAMRQTCGTLFRTWNHLGANPWASPKHPPDAIPLGHFDFQLASIPRGMPDHDDLEVETTRIDVPALLTFPHDLSVLIQHDSDQHSAAIELQQTIMLRLLASLPAGKARFTIVDPVGLGENFSAFMHLTDYDEMLVNSRIWTEPMHIERRLADLTEHMETILQTYLRNEFADIVEYNDHAGEVAEPFHFLVIADFPAGFSDQAVKRLKSILNSGPRCGVHVLMCRDPTVPLPDGIVASDLEQAATRFSRHNNRWTFGDTHPHSLPFHHELLPDPATFANVIRAVGEQSTEARHVEVSFDRIAPLPDQIWSRSSQRGIDIPLGRAGAVRLQHLRLGRGTSQHVLIAGKTGSGKSTLLHILITNLALHYSPDEVELFLIDFKKGVEFKAYANSGLPHARVIAVESDREFGLSVLEKLDGILRERGELFRSVGVQDLASFRDAKPDVRMPRALLIIDEFQEFFVEDDQISQRTSLLLDRLVRQGRAFGIHVFLGSQTLGGAYSLARSTMGQVAVRIALQCSETDAHLILSEDNMAARLLARPGEAIYNDANGLVEGNHPFQIAWLDDDKREERILNLAARANEEGKRIPDPIVFEGNVAANIASNVTLVRDLQSPAREVPDAVRLWLGDPVSISEPAVITLNRVSGQNMLIVGRHEVMAQGIASAAIISTAGQLSPDNLASALCILESSAADDLNWHSVATAMGLTAQVSPPENATQTVGQIHAELQRRGETNGAPTTPILLLVNGLSRCRTLRREEDDFGFGGLDTNKPASPARQFTEILRDGPSVGIHTMVWSDTWNNVTRWLAPQTIREFEYRVAFQMNATDSSNLLDSPAAARLGVNRALLYRDDLGTLEKFRPYGRPDDDWISAITRHGASPASDATVEDIDSWTVT